MKSRIPKRHLDIVFDKECCYKLLVKKKKRPKK